MNRRANQLATHLFKTEPSAYSFHSLLREKTCTWDGVSNPQALANLRAVKAGDEVLIYHTGDEKQVVGLAKVTKAAYPDPNLDDEKRVVVDLKAVKAAKSPLTLAAIKADPRFKEFVLVRNSRLSVMAVPPALDKIIRAATGL